MKTLLKIFGSLVVIVIVALIILRIAGLNPKDRRAGLWLTGDLVTTPVADWSFTNNYETVAVQTNTWYLLPHSVTTYCVVYDGLLYLASSIPPGVPPYPHSRQWNEAVARNPHVRIKIGNQLFDRKLTYTNDPTVVAGVVAAREKKYPNYQPPSGTTYATFRVDDN